MNPNTDPCGIIDFLDTNAENVDTVREKLKKVLSAGILLPQEVSCVEELMRRS